MSKIKQLIEITPPLHVQAKAGEVFTLHGFDCPNCNGRGLFSAEQTGHHEYDQKTCNACKGTGKLQAKIVVGWLPDDI